MNLDFFPVVPRNTVTLPHGRTMPILLVAKLGVMDLAANTAEVTVCLEHNAHVSSVVYPVCSLVEAKLGSCCTVCAREKHVG